MLRVVLGTEKRQPKLAGKSPGTGLVHSRCTITRHCLPCLKILQTAQWLSRSLLPSLGTMLQLSPCRLSAPGERFPFWLSDDCPDNLYLFIFFLKRSCSSKYWCIRMHPSWTMDDPRSCKRWFHSQKAKNIKSSVLSVLFDSPWWCFVTFWNEFCSFILQWNTGVTGWNPVFGQQGFKALQHSWWSPSVTTGGELHSFLKIGSSGSSGISSSGFPFSHFYQIIRQNHAIFMTINCWPDNKTELPKPTCWLAGLCQSWKCLGFTSKRQFGVYNVCEKSEVETHLYLPLLEYDKIDTNSYQIIGVASKRGWLLLSADLLGLLAPWSPGMPVRIAETAWPWRIGYFVLLPANHRHAHGTCQCWLMAEVQSWIPPTGRGSLPGHRWTALGPSVPFP